MKCCPCPGSGVRCSVLGARVGSAGPVPLLLLSACHPSLLSTILFPTSSRPSPSPSVIPSFPALSKAILDGHLVLYILSTQEATKVKMALNQSHEGPRPGAR
jgi:hypothetical protein